MVEDLLTVRESRGDLRFKNRATQGAGMGVWVRGAFRRALRGHAPETARPFERGCLKPTMPVRGKSGECRSFVQQRVNAK